MARWCSISVAVLWAMRLMTTSSSISRWFTSLQQQLRSMRFRFILKTRDYNMKAAELSIKGNYGHCLGKTMDRPLSHGIFGDNIFSHIISRTASACDARMGGAMIPVMSNSGSGNQGICATNPVVVYALGEREYRGGNDPCPDAQSSDGHLYQAEPRQAFSSLRLCGSQYGQQLRHHLSDGWRLYPHLQFCQEYDSQSHRYDL